MFFWHLGQYDYWLCVVYQNFSMSNISNRPDPPCPAQVASFALLSIWPVSFEQKVEHLRSSNLTTATSSNTTSNSSHSLATSALVPLGLAAGEPFQTSPSWLLELFPAFEIADQPCKDEKCKEKGKANAAKNNDNVGTEKFFLFVFFGFAANLSSALTKAEWTGHWLVLDYHIPEGKG